MDSSRWSSYSVPLFRSLPIHYDTDDDFPGPRCGHTLTAIPVGNSHRLILFGGLTTIANPSGGILSNSVHCFDATNQKWKRVYPEGDGPSPRAAHAATAMESIIVIQGGMGTSGPCDEDLYFLLLKDDQFKWHKVATTGEGPGPRYGHVMGVVSKRLVIFGGKVGDGVQDDTWALDIRPSLYTWERLTPYGTVPSGRMYASAGSRDDGVFVVSGGRDFMETPLGDSYWLEMYGEGWWMWNSVPGIAPSQRYHHTVVFVNPRMHVIGGVVSRFGLTYDEAAVAVVNTLTGDWLDGNGQNLDQLTRRSRHAAASFGNCIYVHGGFREGALLDDFLFADDDASQPSTSEPLIPPVMLSHNSSSGNAMEIETLLNFPSLADAFYTPYLGEYPPTWNGSETDGHWAHLSLDNESQRSDNMNITFMPESDKMSDNTFPRPTSVKTLCQKVISTLLKPRDWAPPENRAFFLNYFDIAELCQAAEEIILQQPMVLDIKAPVKVFGDLHGQFGDMMRLFKEFGSPSRTGDIAYIDYLFLGDYVDRGKHSLETIVLLLALKIENPNSFHLIRGNHESNDVNTVFGFLNESKERLGHCPGTQAWSRINRLFNNLPLAAVIENKIFCVHGGIGKSLETVEQIRNIQRPILPTQIQGVVKELLWSDPTANDSILGIQTNQRGPCVVCFGPDIVQAFCEKNNLNMILRGHECVLDGFERFAEGKLITVFSATNYCGSAKNAGAILIVGRDMVIYPKLIHPLPPPISPSENPFVETWQQELNIERPPTPARGRAEPGGAAAAAERFIREQQQQQQQEG